MPGGLVGRRPLGLAGVLDVAQDEREAARLPRGQLDGEVVRADRVPARGDGVRGCTGARNGGLAQGVVGPHERVAIGVEAGGAGVHPVDRVVVPTLPVLGAVVDGRSVGTVELDLHLGQGQVALVVGLVVVGVPERELQEREEPDGLGLCGVVRQGHLLDLGVAPERDEVQHRGREPTARAGDPRVAHAVPGLERVELGLDRHPRRGPDVTAVVDVEVPTAGVVRDVVVAVAREPTHARIAVEGVPAGGVRDQREELLGPQVVDPRVGGARGRDDVLTGRIIEVPVAHVMPP